MDVTRTIPPTIFSLVSFFLHLNRVVQELFIQQKHSHSEDRRLGRLVLSLEQVMYCLELSYFKFSLFFSFFFFFFFFLCRFSSPLLFPLSFNPEPKMTQIYKTWKNMRELNIMWGKAVNTRNTQQASGGYLWMGVCRVKQRLLKTVGGF